MEMFFLQRESYKLYVSVPAGSDSRIVDCSWFDQFGSRFGSEHDVFDTVSVLWAP